MKDINEYFADKCGVTLYTPREINEHGRYWFSMDGDVWNDREYEWTIQDPRVREIIRERFKVETIWTELPEMWMSEARHNGKDYSEEAQTIEEAELSCLKAIHEKEAK